LVKKIAKIKKDNINTHIEEIKHKHAKRTAVRIAAFIALGVLVFTVLMTVVAGLLPETDNAFVGFFQDTNEKIFGGKAAAYIGDQQISMKELDSKYAQIPPEYQNIITKDKLLDQLIDEKVLLIEASSQGIEVTEEEVNASIKTILDSYMLTEEQLMDELESKGMPYQEFYDYYRNEIMITKLLEQDIGEPEVSDEEATAYYDANVERFSVPEQVNASHILICHQESQRCESDLTKEEADEKAKSILARLEDGEDFATLAMEESDCPSAAQGGNLGFFAPQQMTKAFEDAAFALEEGETSDVVETEFGFHIIKVHDKEEASVMDFETIKPEIVDVLRSEKQQGMFETYLSGLKNETVIRKNI